MSQDLTLEERFDAFEDEDLDFKQIAQPLHRRRDICAMMLLDQLLPAPDPGDDIIAGADHDIVYLEGDTEELNERITDDQIRDLIRCGIFYSGEHDGLVMFA